ncbi:hypothetical protein [Tropicimonas sediminicola]|uniref:Uncharacterized protein n=1 Tax=Tropicimonas sediminicola TaxID=1031541 RepID=A0A239DCL1_9RHOB|nr:hypothetical protein [Tropicimonas sediminicola]SNS29604.1 hypothetical protein SAMN05421757_101739 [Tropicimonas sediminicola]
MNKTVGIILAAVVVVLAIWYLMGSGQEPPAEAEPPAASESSLPAETGDVAAEAETEAESAIESAAEAMGEAADALKDAAADMEASTEEMIAGLSAALTSATAEVSGDLQSALDGIDTSALSVENFNYDNIVAKIEASNLSEENKQTIIATLDKARQSPEALQAALESFRTAMEQ